MSTPKTPRTLNDFPSDVLTVEEAAEVLRMSRNAAYDSIGRGEVPIIRLGRRILVPKLALVRMFENAQPQGEAAPAATDQARARAQILRISP